MNNHTINTKIVCVNGKCKKHVSITKNKCNVVYDRFLDRLSPKHHQTIQPDSSNNLLLSLIKSKTHKSKGKGNRKPKTNRKTKSNHKTKSNRKTKAKQQMLKRKKAKINNTIKQLRQKLKTLK